MEKLENKKNFRKKNILILGGLGFIGRNLIDAFCPDDTYNIIVFDIATIDNDLYNKIRSDFSYYRGNFIIVSDLEKIFIERDIDIVIHLVSTTVPSNSNGDKSIFDIESNLIGTVNLLNLMVKYRVPKIIFTSSGGTVYGVTDTGKVTENDLTNPISSHGIVKQSIEKYLFLYQHLYGIDYLVLRLSNPYGEHHKSGIQGFINVALSKAIKKEPIIVWGRGDIIRDYIYVKDCSKIIKELIKKQINNSVINIGAGIGYSINDILAIIKNVAGDIEVRYENSRNFDVPKIVLDITKLNKYLNFDFTNIDIGIRKTYEWQLKKK